MRHTALAAVLGAAVLGLAAAPATAQTRLADPISDPIPLGDITVGLRTVADGMVNPVTGVAAPGDRDHMYVVEQRGVIWQVETSRHDRREDGTRPSAPRSKRLVADYRSLVVPLGCFGIEYDERGAFGLAFDPNWRRNGRLYTFTSEPPASGDRLPPNQCNTQFPDHDNVIREWRVRNPRAAHPTVDPASSRVVLRIPHPQFNHNGGTLLFGPDGLLYITLGDGGGEDDQGPGHAPQGNAQDLGDLHGKVLRIDPRRRPGRAYLVPRDNPFVGVEGARPEIWAYGFRNPYKASFDRHTGDLYVADVGQNQLEEVDIVVEGGNYGWRRKEGSFAFDPAGPDPQAPEDDGFVTDAAVPGLFDDPIAEYDHCLGPVLPTGCTGTEGVAIVGGYVYRGREIAELKGHYVFGDYSRGFFSSDGRLFYLGRGETVLELRLASGRERLGLGLLGIGQDGNGELYVLGKSGAVPGNTGITDESNTSGVVQRIVLAPES